MYPLPYHRREGSGATITSGRIRRTSRVTFRLVSGVTSRKLSEECHGRHTQELRGGPHLPFPDGPHRLPCRPRLIGACGPVGDAYVVHLASLPNPPSHRPSAEELGVVGVGEEHERA